MTGVSAGINGAKNVRILNASSRIGLKILMAGGGRCNITNAQLNYKKFYGASPNAIKKVILQFPPKKVIEFLHNEGLRTKIEEPWSKYFPVTDKAQSVLDVFLEKLKKLKIDIDHPIVVESFSRLEEENKWSVTTNQENYICKNLVIACGGFSYPHTGSDGKLWNKISQLGVKMAKHYPALTPIKTSDSHFHKLKGISVTCELEVKKEEKIIHREHNPILFTHGGLSGPAILNISQWFTQAEEKTKLYINFLPETNMIELEKKLLSLPHSTKIENFLSRYFPRRFAQTLVNIACNSDMIKGELSKTERKLLLQNIFRHQPTIIGNHGYKKAEITGGGIVFSELNSKTMAFKNVTNLYAVGEIIDVHGDIGGYNFQWAWSSGWVCGKALATRGVV